MAIDLKKLQKQINSLQDEDLITKYFKKTQDRRLIFELQLERFHQKNTFSIFVEKVVEKYNSDQYKDRWYNRGIEPEEMLYFFLLGYSKKYGRECNEKEWEEYGNMFVVSLYFVNDYYISLLQGQGSVVHITKKK